MVYFSYEKQKSTQEKNTDMHSRGAYCGCYAAACRQRIRKAVHKGYDSNSGNVIEGEYDCILVLGAGVWSGGRPSHMLADRLDVAIDAYKAGGAPKLLMSGDHGRKEYDEVNVMKDYAIEAGVPSEDVFMDHAGFSTYESIYRARDVFLAERVLIVTQGYHLYRALYVARSLGLEAEGVAADLRPYRGQRYYDLREVLARCKDFAMCIFKPLPTYLGEAIPVSGSGDLTND